MPATSETIDTLSKQWFNLDLELDSKNEWINNSITQYGSTAYKEPKISLCTNDLTYSYDIGNKIDQIYNSRVEYDYGLDAWSTELKFSTWGDVQPQRRRIGSPSILTKRKRKGLGRCDQPEQKARDLLQRFIGIKRFGRYMRDGFINHVARSGKIYQIFPSHGHTMVWENGKIVEELCLCVSKLPPTDSVVMRLLLLQHSEDTFRYHKDVRVWMKASDRRAVA